MEIWRAHANNLRNIRLHRARKHDRYAKELPKYSTGTQVLVRNFTRNTMVLSNNAYEPQKPNSRTFKVNVHHIRPYGTGKGRKTKQPANVDLHNLQNHVLRNRETLNVPNRLKY